MKSTKDSRNLAALAVFRSLYDSSTFRL